MVATYRVNRMATAASSSADESCINVQRTGGDNKSDLSSSSKNEPANGSILVVPMLSGRLVRCRSRTASDLARCWSLTSAVHNSFSEKWWSLSSGSGARVFCEKLECVCCGVTQLKTPLMSTSHPQRSWGTCGKSGFLDGGALYGVMHVEKQVENQQTHTRNL